MANSLESAVEMVFCEFLRQSPALAAMTIRPRDADGPLALPAIVVSAVEQGQCWAVRYQGRYGSELELTIEIRSLYRPPEVCSPSRAQIRAAQLDEIVAGVTLALEAPDPARAPGLARLAQLTLMERQGDRREEDGDRRLRKLEFLVAAVLK